MINPRTVIAKTSFGRGTFTLADGTDAFEYLERKCGEN